MSNFLAIATVTAALRHILQNAINTAAATESGAVSNATVTSLRPDGSDSGMPENGINLYLYQVSPNAAYRNADLPTRRPDGTLVQRPQIALDLHYLLNFYGHENDLVPQRLLGLAVRRLHSHSFLTRQMIRDTLADPLFSYLAGSDLAEQIELVRFSPLNLTLEDLSKLWSVFFQTPYTLSLAYQGTLVLIESDESSQTALPVRQPNLYVLPLSQPVVEQVLSDAGADQPILADSTLLIRGQRLRGAVTKIRIAGQEVEPLPPITDTQLKLPLSSLQPGTLQAGVQGLQVVHPLLMGTPPLEHRGVESNVAAFVLHPKIEEDPVAEFTSVLDEGPFSGSLTLKVAPAIGRAQPVVVLLNQILPASEKPAAYSFKAPSRNPDTAPEMDETITITFQEVKRARYLVRIQVAGAESPLEMVKGKYGNPQVNIP